MENSISCVRAKHKRIAHWNLVDAATRVGEEDASIAGVAGRPPFSSCRGSGRSPQVATRSSGRTGCAAAVEAEAMAPLSRVAAVGEPRTVEWTWASLAQL
jgi:hypothetical protein